MVRNIFLLAVLILSIHCNVSQENRKLVFVQQVFRHGARYPLSSNSKDGSNATGIVQNLGELTNQGKSQHYLLGKKLYQTYWEPLFGKNNTYRQEKFYFKSTDVHRTIQSLQSQLLGIFENTDILKIGSEQVNFSLPVWSTNFTRQPGSVYEKSQFYHPFPIHVQKAEFTPWSEGDYLLTYWPDYCIKQHDWIQANLRDPYNMEIINNKNFVDAAKTLGQVLQENLTFYDVASYIDNAKALLFLGKNPLPIFIGDTQLNKDMQVMTTLEGYMRLFHSEYQLGPISTPLFNETINHFKRVTKDQQEVQWAFYSAHDTTIQNILARMGLASVQCIYKNYLNGTLKDNQNEYCIVQYPGYSSQIIFEVYQYENKTSTFQVRYNGNYRRIPFCGWQLQCDVEVIYKWYQSWKDEDWVRSCGIKNNTTETYFSIIIIELAVIIVFAVATVIRYLDKKKPQIEKHQKTQKDGIQPAGQIKEANLLKQSLISEENQNS